MSETDPNRLVEFQTNVEWSFHVPEAGDAPASWGATRYKSNFVPGERLSVPRSIAEDRQAVKLGTIIEIASEVPAQ